MYLRIFKSIFFSFEMIFLLFLISGTIKETELLSWLPVDATILLLLLNFLVGLYLLFRRNLKILIDNRISITVTLVGCFFFWILISITWSLSVDYALDKLIKILLLLGWSFFAGVFIVGSSIERVRRFFSLVVIFSLLFSMQFTFLVFEHDKSNTLQSLSNDYIVTSTIISTALLLFSVYYFVTTNKFNIKNTFLILIQLHLLAIVFSLGAKGPLVALFVSYVVLSLYLFVLQNKSSYFRKTIKYFIYLVYITSFLLLVDYEQFRAVERFNDLIINFSEQSDFGGRVWLNLTALSMWEESPIIGKGIGSFGIYAYNQDFRAYPHNIFTETMSELGLIGLMLLISIFYVTLRMVPRSDNVMFAIPYIVFIFYLVTSQFSGSLSDHRLLFALLGIMSASSIYLSRPELIKYRKPTKRNLA